MATTARPCMGTFDNNASVVTLQQSPTAEIPWLIELAPANAAFGWSLAQRYRSASSLVRPSSSTTSISC